MNTLALSYGNPLTRPTASASKQGLAFGRLRLSGSFEIAQSATTTEERLRISSRQALAVIRENIRDLGADRANSLIERVEELLHPDVWEEGDDFLKVTSVRTLVRTLIALDCEVGAVAITRDGNLAITWSENNRDLRVECLPDGHVSWAAIVDNDSNVIATHKKGDTIANLRSFCNA